MSRLAREGVLLLTAVQFLTRLPVPARLPFHPDAPVRATRYFPLAGLLVGALCAAVWLTAGRVWPGRLAAWLAVGAGVLATGAFHEDGLADTADGLGGGLSPARRLEIMKDSRIGTYGAVALGLSLALRAEALAGLQPLAGACALLAAHAAGRAAAVVVMAATPYVGDRGGAKGRPGATRPSAGEAAAACVLGFAPLLLLPTPALALAVLLAGAGAGLLARACVRLIGGHTGDALGAVEQVAEVAVLAGACAFR